MKDPVDPEDENEASKAVAAALWPQMAVNQDWTSVGFLSIWRHIHFLLKNPGSLFIPVPGT